MNLGLPELFILAIVSVIALFLLTAVIATGVFVGTRLSRRAEGGSQQASAEAGKPAAS